MGMRERGPDGRGGSASRPSGWPVLRTPMWMFAAGGFVSYRLRGSLNRH